MNNSTDTSVSLGNGTYIEQKKSEYEKKFTDFITMQRESSANKENIWNFIESTIKETLLMAKEKTMLEDITPKNYNQVFLGARAEGIIDGYTQAISDTEERWKELGV